MLTTLLLLGLIGAALALLMALPLGFAAPNGTAVNFGFTGTANGITISGISGFLQSAEYSNEADHDDVRNNIGDIVARGWYDFHQKGTFEWVISGTGLADAITKTTIASLTPGTIITITACASLPDLVGTKWEVVAGVSIKGSNTNAKRISVPVEFRSGIQSAAPA
ncbi:MAG TPA: hypothetical protein VG028_13255 [Terriglobia bacterium]|nr:hypothetical protein [Terriglobia bacterium]